MKGPAEHEFISTFQQTLEATPAPPYAIEESETHGALSKASSRILGCQWGLQLSRAYMHCDRHVEGSVWARTPLGNKSKLSDTVAHFSTKLLTSSAGVPPRPQPAMLSAVHSGEGRASCASSVWLPLALDQSIQRRAGSPTPAP